MTYTDVATLERYMYTLKSAVHPTQSGLAPFGNSGLSIFQAQPKAPSPAPPPLQAPIAQAPVAEVWQPQSPVSASPPPQEDTLSDDVRNWARTSDRAGSPPPSPQAPTVPLYQRSGQPQTTDFQVARILQGEMLTAPTRPVDSDQQRRLTSIYNTTALNHQYPLQLCTILQCSSPSKHLCASTIMWAEHIG